MNQTKWKVVVNEQDGMGGGRNKDIWFDDYDDAHDFYVYIKSLKGTPFYPSISEPPTKAPFTNYYAKGEWKRP